MFTALEGPGIGHQEQPQLKPVSTLCIEPELIKPPPVPRFVLVCLSFHRGASAALPGARDRGLVLDAGAAHGLLPSSLVLGQWPGTVP